MRCGYSVSANGICLPSRDDNLVATFVGTCDDRVAVERCVRERQKGPAIARAPAPPASNNALKKKPSLSVRQQFAPLDRGVSSHQHARIFTGGGG
jgi:hypothetical protein